MTVISPRVKILLPGSRRLIKESELYAEEAISDVVAGTADEIGAALMRLAGDGFRFGWKDALRSGVWFRYPHETKAAGEEICGELALRMYFLAKALARGTGIDVRYWGSSNYNRYGSHAFVTLSDGNGDFIVNPFWNMGGRAEIGEKTIVCGSSTAEADLFWPLSEMDVFRGAQYARTFDGIFSLLCEGMPIDALRETMTGSIHTSVRFDKVTRTLEHQVVPYDTQRVNVMLRTRMQVGSDGSLEKVAVTPTRYHRMFFMDFASEWSPIGSVDPVTGHATSSLRLGDLDSADGRDILVSCIYDIRLADRLGVLDGLLTSRYTEKPAYILSPDELARFEQAIEKTIERKPLAEREAAKAHIKERYAAVHGAPPSLSTQLKNRDMAAGLADREFPADESRVAYIEKRAGVSPETYYWSGRIPPLVAELGKEWPVTRTAAIIMERYGAARDDILDEMSKYPAVFNPRHVAEFV